MWRPDGGGNGISQDRVDHTKTMKDRSGCGGINEISRSGIRLRWVWGVTTVKDLECLAVSTKSMACEVPSDCQGHSSLSVMF